jgi:hypothetical protein
MRDGGYKQDRTLSQFSVLSRICWKRDVVLDDSIRGGGLARKLLSRLFDCPINT